MTGATDSTNPESEETFHQGTSALENLANEVEKERAQRGRSNLDPIVLSDGTAMADELSKSHDGPTADASAKVQEDSESDEGGVSEAPLRPRVQHPH